MGRIEENMDVVRRWIEAVNKQDPALLEDFVTPNYSSHMGPLQGREGYMQ